MALVGLYLLGVLMGAGGTWWVIWPEVQKWRGLCQASGRVK